MSRLPKIDRARSLAAWEKFGARAARPLPTRDPEKRRDTGAINAPTAPNNPTLDPLSAKRRTAALKAVATRRARQLNLTIE